MLTIVAYNILLLAISGYAWWRGGAPERYVAILFVLASGATLAAPWDFGTTYRSVHRGMFVIDLLLLGAVVGVALLADRFWPMWIGALQLVAIGAHGVRAYQPGLMAMAYWWGVNKIAYPMLILLAIATYRHARRVRDGQPEFDWTRQRWRDADLPVKSSA